jgi:L-alanine-DL-glutamate epimerase-like enolase superfamily enzyme
MKPTIAEIEHVAVDCFRFPTPAPESDGTLTWDATTAVTVELAADGVAGLGWTYSSPAAVAVVETHLRPLLMGHRCADIAALWASMRAECRNIGTKGLVMQAISAVDIALWDLEARMLGTSLAGLFGRVRDRVPVYGSGGFTSADDQELSDDIAHWRAAGCESMKIKIGRDNGGSIQWDLNRIALFHELAGGGVQLMVDANGAYTVGQAMRVGAELDRHGVCWFEEPVTSDDEAGLATVRSDLRCDVTAGEYVSDIADATRLVRAVDCLQLDVTRCGGYTGFLRSAAVARAHEVPVSAHCAPALHAPVAAAIPVLRHIEWFKDHECLEPLLVDGVPVVKDGTIDVPIDCEGHGMSLAATASAYRVPAKVTV